MRKLIITNYKDKRVGVLIENNKTIRIEAYGYQKESIINNIYVGRVRDVVANINAAFVEIAPQVVCYLSLKDNQNIIFLNRKNTNKVCQGDLLLVQVSKAAVKTKDAVVTCNISLPGKYAALEADSSAHVGVSRKITDSVRAGELKKLIMPYCTDRISFIIRTDAANAADSDIIEEVRSLIAQYETMIQTAATRTAFTVMYRSRPELINDIEALRLTGDDEIVTDMQEVFDTIVANLPAAPVRMYNDTMLSLTSQYSIMSRIEAALKPHVWLKSGGYLVIEPTEALTVIDVNSGKFDGRGQQREETFLKINLEAADTIATELAVRNISGIIIVDFISMTCEANREAVRKRLCQLIAKDPVRTVFVEFTRLDLAELTRKKIKPPLYEMLK